MLSCMAAAADRLVDDPLVRVSPELVLVDAALSEEMRRRLGVPDDTLGRIGRMPIGPRVSVHVAAVPVDEGREAQNNASAGDELLPMPATALEVAHHEAGIEDLIVRPENELPSLPPTLLVVPDERGTGLVPETQESVASRVSEVYDPVVVSAEDGVQPQSTHQSYPALPSPPSDADDEDATEAVLRQIRDQIGHETSPKRGRRRLRHGLRRG
jgi:hypothetical protein